MKEELAEINETNTADHTEEHSKSD